MNGRHTEIARERGKLINQCAMVSMQVHVTITFLTVFKHVVKVVEGLVENRILSRSSESQRHSSSQTVNFKNLRRKKSEFA